MIVASSAIGLPLAAIVAPPPPKNIAKRDDHHDRRGERRRHRADQDVAVLHVRQLVREHAFELLVVQDLQDALGGGHGRVLRVPARGERVRRRVRNDVAARLRQAGARRQALHDAVRADGPGPTSAARYIRSTILSENQYETKLVTTAKRKPRTRPCAPPSASPRNSSSALIAPSSSAVLTVLDMVRYSTLSDAPAPAGGSGGRIIRTCSP